MLSTSLLDTEALSFLREAGAVQIGHNLTLQAQVAPFDNARSGGLVNSDTPVSEESLRETVEQAFQKVTISLMKSPALQ